MHRYIKPAEIQRSNLQNFDFAHMLGKLAGSAIDSPKFIHVGGVSAAGKTTLSLLLKSELPDAQGFSIDSYLIEGLGKMSGVFSDEPPEGGRPYIGGITPEVWEMSLVELHMQQLKNNQPIQMPVFDEAIKDRAGYVPFMPSKYIIFEGGHSFGDNFRDHADYSVLVTAPFHDRLVRKIVRTHARYRRDDIDDIVGRYLTKDEPSWRFYEEEFSEIADQVFPNPANPEVDYMGLSEARYAREDGVYHRLNPKPESGILRAGEEFGFIVRYGGEFQLCYSIAGRELVNLPLAKEFIEMLGNFYDITSAKDGAANAEGV